MKVVAPGKILLFGAYSVLEGTEALVVAVDRYAVADTDRLAPSVSREVRAAIGETPAPVVDVGDLHRGGDKLGLGSSAAALVATLGAQAAMKGDDLASEAVRAQVFLDSKRAHAAAQGGGSGVDIAASTYGGALFYRMADPPEPFLRQTELPPGLALRVFWSGTSARTSDLVAQVKRLGERDRLEIDRRIAAIGDCVMMSVAACRDRDTRALVQAGIANARALADLGKSADAPIVPPTFADLALLAAREGAAFYPSGAGGGDVGVWLGCDPPSEGFLEHSHTLGMRLVDLGIDRAGMRIRKD